jgi:immune inhibitor A
VRRALLALASAFALVVLAGSGSVSSRSDAATPGAGAPARDTVTGHEKQLPKFVEKWQANRKQAADLVARGQRTPDANGVVTLKNGKRVRYKLQGTEYLTTALIDFSDVTHGNIAQPDRTVDNSTYWSADVSPQHYRDMLFTPGGGSYGYPSFRDFYLELSSGRFTWDGQVSNWVQVPEPESEFGANSRSGGDGSDNLNGTVYRVVQATLQALAASGNYGGLNLAVADRVDRYDCDGDGVFAEPDGYIDHFAIAHAGQGEEEGGGTEGGDAIWSHRWYANFNQDEGPTGCHLGGYQLPGTSLWVGDYTIEPENGGVGVFAHEMGHDLGLPDLYDTNAGENGTGFWTLMSSGSWASYATDNIGTAPVQMGAWEKLALGWLDLGVAQLGDDKMFDLGPAETATRNRFQALRVNLPNYTRTTTAYPVDGADPNYYYSGKGDDIDNSMSKTLPSALGSTTSISFRADWDIETDWDYAYLDALVNGTWQHIDTSASTTTDPNGQNFGFGITGSSGGWATVTGSLPAGTSAFRFRYWTDGATVRPGFAVDSIQIGSGPVDDSTNTAGWTLAGFQQLTNGQFTESLFHYYLAESRNYLLGDRSLCGAYNFLFGNWLEKQCYANGLLISYRNAGYTDNNTSEHPGAGQILPIDSHPATMIRPDGRTAWRSRWQVWDAPFGLDSHQITLSQWINQSRTLTQTYTAAPVSSFNDSSPTAYYNSALPYTSVKTAGSGLRIDIVGASADRTNYSVRVH